MTLTSSVASGCTHALPLTHPTRTRCTHHSVRTDGSAARSPVACRYTRPANDVFVSYDASLRAMYEAFCSAGLDTKLGPLEARVRAKLMDLYEWESLLQLAGLFDDEFTRRHASLCFVWAQSFCTDDIKRRTVLTHLSYAHLPIHEPQPSRRRPPHPFRTSREPVPRGRLPPTAVLTPTNPPPLSRSLALQVR
jgi:hypothetical protein